MIPIPLIHFVEYLRGSIRAREAILRELIFRPDKAQRAYDFYQRARSAIRGYHRKDADREKIENLSASWRKEALSAKKQKGEQLANNAEVLERYLSHQGDRHLALTRERSFSLVNSQVRIGIRPALCALEHRASRFILHHLGVDQLDPLTGDFMLQLLFKAAQREMPLISMGAVELIDIRRGRIHKLDTLRSLDELVAETCADISKAVPQLRAPEGWKPKRLPPQLLLQF